MSNKFVVRGVVGLGLLLSPLSVLFARMVEQDRSGQKLPTSYLDDLRDLWADGIAMLKTGTVA